MRRRAKSPSRDRSQSRFLAKDERGRVGDRRREEGREEGRERKQEKERREKSERARERESSRERVRAREREQERERGERERELLLCVLGFIYQFSISHSSHTTHKRTYTRTHIHPASSANLAPSISHEMRAPR
jgi:hypothetical protein